MRSFLINLDRSPERLAFFQEQAAAAGLTFERVSAVDGSTLDEAAFAKSVSPEFKFQPVNAGEAALFISHRNCWQKLLESDELYAAVFEDDALLATETGETLTRIETLNQEADVIKLETTLRRVVLKQESLEAAPGFRLHQLLSWHGGTAAYVVSRIGAEKLLRATMPLADPVDQVMFNPLSPVCDDLEIVQVVPALAVQHDILKSEGDGNAFPSTIGRHGRRRLFRHGLLTDLKRAWLKHKERRRRFALAKLPGHLHARVDFAEG